MQDNSIDLLFPSRFIELMCDIRGELWRNFINGLIDLEPTSPERISFVLMMVRLGGCFSCQSDSFRAIRGCILCSNSTVKRYKGSDQSLIELYNEAKIEVINYMKEVTDYDS